MDLHNEIEEDVNLFDLVDDKELIDEDDKEFVEPDNELNFEKTSLEGYTEMLEQGDEDTDILE